VGGVIIKVGAIITSFFSSFDFLIYCNFGKSDMLRKAKGVVIMRRGELDWGLLVFFRRNKKPFFIYCI